MSDNLQFYPTPLPLAIKAWRLFKNKSFARILEPSCGEGHLVVTSEVDSDGEQKFSHLANVALRVEDGGRSYDRIQHRVDWTDCFEIDVSKHDVLRKKFLNVVGLDFMQFTQGSIYSHIIMNPPFMYGAQHTVHAWDILYDGEIVSIINAETIRNPFSKERQYLVDLIQKYGSVEFLQDTFVEAERTTSVEIALVYLRKESKVDEDIYGDILDKLKVDEIAEEDLMGNHQEINAVALPSSFIENQVKAFNAAVLAEKEAIFAGQRAKYYSGLLGKTIEEFYQQESTLRKADANATISKAIAVVYSELKNRAWTSILTSTAVTSRLSSKAQKRVESDFEDIKKLEFNASNIYGFLAGISHKQGEIQLDMACDVFDLITQYHSENTVFYMGWKSNDNHRTCGMSIKTTRFVIPNNNSYGSFCYTAKQRLNDIDKVFAMLDGKQSADVSLVSLFEDKETFKQLRDGERLSGTYFDVRYHKGIGTIHFFARNKKLVDRLNLLVGRQRAWLPPEGERVNDAFWIQYQDSEKFDKEFRAEIKSKTFNRFDDTLRGLSSRDELEKQRANDKACDAIGVVLERRGININAALSKEEVLMLKAS